MDEYIGKDYKQAISSFMLKKGIAKETNNEYVYLSLTLCNGYEQRIFLNADKMFAIKDAFRSADVTKDVDSLSF